MMKACPEPLQLSMFCDDAAGSDAARIAAHLERCPRCRSVVAEERRLSAAIGALACPDPETLAQFIDEALAPARLEQVAGHVLRCEPCRDVVAWTREAQIAASEKRASGRRRRRALPGRRTSPWAAILGAGAAVAAALVLVVLLRGQPGGGGQMAHGPDQPRPERPLPPTERPPETPQTPEQPAPPEQPTPEQPTPEQPTPPAQPEQPTGPTTPVEPRADDGVLVAALDEGAFTLRRGEAAARPLQGAARVARGEVLAALREGGALQVGRATCLLGGGGELVCASVADDPVTALTLTSGEVLVDAPDAGLELRAGEAAVRAAPGGARYSLGLSGGSAILCVVSGEAHFGPPGRAIPVSAGAAARWEKGQVRPEKRPDAALARAQELAHRAEVAASVDVPRGLVALRALRAAEEGLAPTASLAARARAAEAVLALRAAEPRLAKLAARLQPAAEAALADLLGREPAALVRDGAAAPTVLAVLARARAQHPGKSSLPEADRAPVQALAEALAARPAAELDAEALLALRATERVGRWRAPRSAFEAAPPADAADALLLALLARKKEPALAARVLAELDRALGESPWTAPLAPAAILRAARSLALLGEETPARHQRLVAHAWAGASGEASLALLVAQETRALLGQSALDLGPASLLVVPAAEGWRVTFVHRPGKRLKSLQLVASWDGWKPEGIAMEARADGSWAVTRILPPGRHEYKLIVDGGDWITDPVNPLRAPSNVNETENSVLLLD